MGISIIIEAKPYFEKRFTKNTTVTLFNQSNVFFVSQSYDLRSNQQFCLSSNSIRMISLWLSLSPKNKPRELLAESLCLKISSSESLPDAFKVSFNNVPFQDGGKFSAFTGRFPKGDSGPNSAELSLWSVCVFSLFLDSLNRMQQQRHRNQLGDKSRKITRPYL